MANIAALQLDRDIDLLPFSQFLHQAGLPHRISEDGDKQVVWVGTDAARDAVLVAYEHYQRGELPTVTTASTGARQNPNGFKIELLRSPATLTLVVANLICFPITLGVDEGQLGWWLRQLTLLDFREMGDELYFADLAYTLESGQWWRLVTPMLIHFGILHLVFNLLWVWDIGRRIEVVCGVSHLLPVVLVSSLAANLTQYGMFGAGLFGGMSGVVFGLLGYALVWSRLLPERSLQVPKGIYVFMFAFLLAGFIGVIDLLGLGSLANGAHLGGLLGGLLVGGLAVLLQRVGRR